MAARSVNVSSPGFQYKCILGNALSPMRAKFIEPMLCRAAPEAPEGPEWQYEIKLDGYRAIGLKTDGRVQLWSRNRNDFSRRFPRVAAALAELPDETVLDGEIIALGGDGLPSFSRLQDFHADHEATVLYAFDLPILGGLDLRRQPLETRRDLLREAASLMPDAIRFSETFDVPATDLMRVVREKGLEGVVAKRRGSTYQGGKRSDDWVKVRANRVGEFIIGGYVPTARSFDSILVGHIVDGRLIYTGSVRAGFVTGMRPEFLADLAKVHAKRCPFTNLPERTRGRWGDGITAERMEQCRWLKPRLFATIEFLELTPENRLRHPLFVGITRGSHVATHARGLCHSKY